MNSEQSFNDVMDRLKMASKSNSYNAMAEMIGLSSSAFANLKKRNSIPYDRILTLANSLNVSIDWLLTGVGNMYRTSATVTPISDRRANAIVTLYETLDADQQQEILCAIKEKQRMNELLATVNELQRKAG